MQRIHDYLGKYVIQQLLDARGTVTIQQETGVPETQYIDACFTPDPALSDITRPPCTRIVDRMSQGSSLFEPYSTLITRGILREAMRKHLTYHHRLVLEAGPGKAAPPLPPLPPLWLLMPGQPGFLLDEFEARPLQGWPAGFYSLAPGLMVYPVFLSQLPVDRGTLPLRLLGGPKLRQAALRELRAIPPGEPDALFLHKIAATLLLALRHDNNIPQADRSILMSELTIEFNRLQQEAFQRGELKILRQMVADFCEVFDIPLTEERQAHVATLSASELAELCASIKAQRAWPLA